MYTQDYKFNSVNLDLDHTLTRSLGLSSGGQVAQEKTGARAPAFYRGREIDLDVVRGFAILLAMGWHLNGPRTGIAPVEILLTPGRMFGWAGVDLFFVLSGFLVGRMIFKEYQRSAGFDYPRFLIRRIFRLWPLLYAFIAVMLSLSGKDKLLSLLKIALHIQNYPFLGKMKTAPHTWSLAVEEQFYVLFAIALDRKTHV